MSAPPAGTTSTPQPVTIRPVRPTDSVELGRFYAGLSADSRYARFLSTRPGISDVAAASFCGPDHEHREGLVAVARDDEGVRRIVGHLCLDPLEDGAFEMAVAVADSWRGLGIGRRLLVASMAWARHHGIARLRATMLATNSPIIALIRSTAQGVRLSSPEAGVIEAVIEIGAEVPAAASTTPRAESDDDTTIVGARGLDVVGRALQGSVSGQLPTHGPATVILAR